MAGCSLTLDPDDVSAPGTRAGADAGDGGDDARLGADADAEPGLDADAASDPGSACIDDDGDGAFRAVGGCPVPAAEIDCNDDDRNVFPGAEEVCNQVDDDCDSITDNNLTAPLCEAQEGACQGATQQCVAGVWTPCDAARFGANNPAYRETEAYCARGVDPSKGWCRDGLALVDSVQDAESGLCDGIDNDCDGEVDELLDLPCFLDDTGLAVNDNTTLAQAVNFCRAGFRRCVDGQYLGVCEGAVIPVAETTQGLRCNDLDNNCDGQIGEACDCEPEDCDCEPGDALVCYPFGPQTLDVGECAAGERRCGDDRRFGPCLGVVGPATETCDNRGRDDDCDGQRNDLTVDGLDEDVLYGDACVVPDTFGVCLAGTWRCPEQGSDPVCESTEEAQGADTDCNGLDDDCDGAADDDVDFNLEPNCGECGVSCEDEDAGCCPDMILSPVGHCVSLRDNPQHCGGCGTISDVYVCIDDDVCCGSRCVDLTSDRDHCGVCDSPVPEGSACCGGVPVHLGSDPNHCGTCGTACEETTVCCIDSNTDPNFPSCYPDVQCD
mgnify:CR=1 FL=1